MSAPKPAILMTRPTTFAAVRAAGVDGVDEGLDFELLVLRWRRGGEKSIGYGVLAIRRPQAVEPYGQMIVLTPDQILRLRASSEGEVLDLLIADFLADERAGHYDGSAAEERFLSDVMYWILLGSRPCGVAVHLSMRNHRASI